jgi:hypothetical protein
MSSRTDFNAVANACKKELETIKESGRELWTERLEAFLDALKEIEIDHDFNGHDAMTIIDLDRLNIAANGKGALKHYINTLPSAGKEVDGFPAIAHAQHLKVIAFIVPIIANLT